LLFDFGGRDAEVSNFSHKLYATRFETNSYVQEFMYNVIKSYYDLFSAVANEKASREDENASREAFKAASVRYKVGTVPLTDKLQAETAYMQKQLAREKAETTTKIKKAELNYLLNLSPTYDLSLSIPMMNVSDRVFDNDVADLIEIATKSRPDLKAMSERRTAKKMEVWSKTTEMLPSLQLNASYNELDYRHRADDRARSYNVEAVVSMPFFTGGSIYNSVAEERTNLKIIDKNLEDLRKSVELDVWTAYQEFQNAKAIYSTSQVLLESATQTEKTMLGRYKNGKSSILDLLNAQSDLATARYEFINAQHNWFIKKANLIRSIGYMDISHLNDTSISITKKGRK